MTDTTTTAPARTVTRGDQAWNQWDWLLVAAAALVIVATAAITWTRLSTPAEPTTPVSGFEYSTEATTGKAASQGVTTQYFGYSEQLEPNPPAVSGFDHSTDATTGRMASEGVTTQYFGYSGQLEPNPPAVSGFDHNTDATTGRMAGESVTTQYFGNNPSFDE